MKLRIFVPGFLSLMGVACTPVATMDQVEIAMPGEFGASFTEIVDDPARVDDLYAARNYRQHNMRLISAAYRSIELILRYDADFADSLDRHAGTLAAAAAAAPQWFTLQSPAEDGLSGARAAIWDEPERFASHLRGFERETGRLAALIDDGAPNRDTLLDGLNAVRHQCLACHQVFRRR